MFHYPFDPASLAETARIWWDLFGYYLFLALVIGGGVMAALVAIPWIYRYKGSGNPNGEIQPGVIPNERGRLMGIAVLALLLLGVFFGLLTQSMRAELEFKDPPETDNALVIEVIAFQWGWTFRYPNGVETDVLIIPTNRVVIFNVTSQDVFHTFAIPDLRVKIDAIPGKYNKGWTIAYQPGIYRLQCYELCGVGHAEMITKVKVVTPDIFNVWYEAGLEAGELEELEVSG